MNCGIWDTVLLSIVVSRSVSIWSVFRSLIYSLKFKMTQNPKLGGQQWFFFFFPGKIPFFQVNIKFNDFSSQGLNSMTFPGLCEPCYQCLTAPSHYPNQCWFLISVWQHLAITPTNADFSSVPDSTWPLPQPMLTSHQCLTAPSHYPNQCWLLISAWQHLAITPTNADFSSVSDST